MSSSASAARSNPQPFSYEEASHSGADTRRTAPEEIAAREAAARSLGRAEGEASSRNLIEQQAIQLKARAIWMQEGVVHEAAAEKARKAGLFVIMDSCILLEHRARFR